MKVVAIIQARMGSTRLPGKVLRPLLGAPMLQHVAERTQRARQLSEVVVATSTLPADDQLAEVCVGLGLNCFRGNELDVLDRYHQAAASCDAEAIVRITADCPLIDPALIDQIVEHFVATGADYASNVAPGRTYPRGLDTEIFSRETLERCWREARDPASREHVTAYIYRHPELFRIASVTHEQDVSEHRWTVDTPEDFALVEKIYASFGHNRFTWLEALAAEEQHPQWTSLNAHVLQKVVG